MSKTRLGWSQGQPDITDNPARSLSGQVVRGFAWLFTGVGVQMILRTLVLAVLSRLLVPEDFGVLSAAMVLVSFVETVAQIGIGPAITQRKNLTDAHVRTGFTLSLLIAIVLVAVSWFSAPMIAAFFNMPEIEVVLYYIVWLFPLRALGLVAEALLVRQLRFNVLTQVEIASYVIGYGTVAILLAYLGLGPSALVYATLAQSGLKSILLLLWQPHSRLFLLDRTALKELLIFGGGFTLGKIGNTLALQGDNFVIGRWLGAEALGLYGRAYHLMVTPATLFGTVTDKVLFPAMAKVQGDQGRLRSA